MPNETPNTPTAESQSLDAVTTWLTAHMTVVLAVLGALLALLVLLFLVRAVRDRRSRRKAQPASFALNSVRSTDYRMRRAATKVLQREYLGWREENPPEKELDERAHPRVTIPEDKIEAVFTEHADILDQVFDPDTLATILYRSGLGFRDEDDLVITPTLIEIRDEKSGLVLVFDCVQPPTPPEQWEHAEELLALQFEAPGLVTRSPVFGERWVYLRNRYAHIVGDVDAAEADHQQVSEKRDQSFKERVHSLSASQPEVKKEVAQVRKADDFDDNFEVEFGTPAPAEVQEAVRPERVAPASELPSRAPRPEREKSAAPDENGDSGTALSLGGDDTVEDSDEPASESENTEETSRSKIRWGRHGK